MLKVGQFADFLFFNINPGVFIVLILSLLLALLFSKKNVQIIFANSGAVGVGNLLRRLAWLSFTLALLTPFALAGFIFQLYGGLDIRHGELIQSLIAGLGSNWIYLVLVLILGISSRFGLKKFASA